MLKEELACCEQVGFDSINQALLEICEKDIFKDEILKYAVFTENEIDSVKMIYHKLRLKQWKKADMSALPKNLSMNLQ